MSLEKLLHIGRMIRESGKPEWKKHGSYWNLDIGGVKFRHDDYNNGVSINSSGGAVYMGMSFGGVEIRAPKHTFDTVIRLLESHANLLEQAKQQNHA